MSCRRRHHHQSTVTTTTHRHHIGLHRLKRKVPYISERTPYLAVLYVQYLALYYMRVVCRSIDKITKYINSLLKEKIKIVVNIHF